MIRSYVNRMQKPRFVLHRYGPEFGFTSRGFGLITDLWLIEVKRRIPFMLRVFSRDEKEHESGVARALRQLMADAAEGVKCT